MPKFEWPVQNPNWSSEIRPFNKRRSSAVMVDSMILLVNRTKQTNLLLKETIFAPLLCIGVMLATFQKMGDGLR